MEQVIFLLFFIILGLCWGSFLNVIAYRITFDKPFFTPRSQCPSCHKIIPFYDNIPVISWILLKRRCRQCKATISWIYPFIEALTGFLISMLALFIFGYSFNSHTLPIFTAYFIFFSALIIATATDFYAMVIPQMVTTWLIPVGLGLAFFSYIKISLVESIIGTIMGYGILWLTGWLFKRTTQQDGIGEGDMELLAMIGSFLGIKGVWCSLMCGSIFGLIGGGTYLVFVGKHNRTPIPFGPFLSLGALLSFFFEHYLSLYLLGGY